MEAARLVVGRWDFDDWGIILEANTAKSCAVKIHGRDDQISGVQSELLKVPEGEGLGYACTYTTVWAERQTFGQCVIIGTAPTDCTYLRSHEPLLATIQQMGNTIRHCITWLFHEANMLVPGLEYVILICFSFIAFTFHYLNGVYSRPLGSY
ncbi:hypothetical protein GGR50DRAFT_255047 [Xylaria sp. CBS 124048]|nr:hypothetical protein GGR50DRAFT_255047 [Xylaria sp. CBS 124048]